MIVQPLVENALKYGVRDQTENHRYVYMRIKKGKNFILPSRITDMD